MLSNRLTYLHTLTLLFILTLLVPASGISQVLDEVTTSESAVRLNVSNIGVFGNAFRGYRDGTNNPSCEFPSGSGTEHLWESGIWIGGTVNGLTYVSTAALDASQGYSTGKAGYEFTAEQGSEITYRSTLLGSPNYSPNAISHEDLIVEFTDKNIIIPTTQIQIPEHNPIMVDVVSETYNWNHPDFNQLVILNFTAVNNSGNLIEDAYVSFWANTVIRNINQTPAGQGGAAFYDKGGNGYVDSLYMGYCFDHSGDPGFTDSYIGQKFLGGEDRIGFHHPDIDSAFNVVTGALYKDDFEVTYNSWLFNSSADPVFSQPTDDNERYIKQSLGLNEEPCWLQNSSTNPSCGSQSIKEQLKSAGNRSDLVSAGPFKAFGAGDTIRFAFALVFGEKTDDGQPNSADTEDQKAALYANAEKAQLLYNGEDINFNGILDQGEDADNNGKITRYVNATITAIGSVDQNSTEASHIRILDQNAFGIQLISDKPFNGQLRIVDVTGRTVYDNSRVQISPSGIFYPTVQLERGYFILQLIDTIGTVSTLRFYKN